MRVRSRTTVCLLLALCWFLVANHCLLEELFALSPTCEAETTPTDATDGTQHRHGEPCSTLSFVARANTAPDLNSIQLNSTLTAIWWNVQHEPHLSKRVVLSAELHLTHDHRSSVHQLLPYERAPNAPPLAGC